ncbi:uncharacterized protein LOC111319380 [Stylophora pistillata]|uniref:uncharacterized protein LOC111319380 n=1 Tax=Stylophora pistillata TaxID=50429 RepID=UPI000C043F17|nr:uncharacterized protein LOC111319380 [Stylophora pistillata]
MCFSGATLCGGISPTDYRNLQGLDFKKWQRLVMSDDLGNAMFLIYFTVAATNGHVSIKPVTAYVTETVNLFYTRSVNDRDSSFRKYAVSKDHVNFITLGQEKDGKDKFFCTENTDYSDICQERFSFRYVNDTHVSFQIRNVTLPDAGLYDCHKYFSEVGVTKDPGYEHINLSVQAVGNKEIMSPIVLWTTSPHSEKPVVETKEINSTIVSRATSHHSGIFQPFFLMLMVVTTLIRALFY